MKPLAQRLERSAMERCNWDKVEALKYLSLQKERYYRKACTTTGHIGANYWRILRAYRTAIYNIQYWLDIEREEW